MNHLSKEEIKILLALLGGFLLLASALFALNFFVVHGQHGVTGDFLMLWTSGRAYWSEKIEPYTAIIPARVQQMVYERTARPGEKPYIVDLPFPLLFPLFPLALIPDWHIPAALWLLFGEFSLLGLAYLSLHLTGWQPRRPILLAFYVFSIFNFYSIQALLQGGFSLFLALTYAAMLFALRDERDEMLGALLALSCFRWEMGGPFLVLMGWRIWTERRWRALFSFAVFALVPLFTSFLVYPDWLIPFLRAVLNNLRTDYGFRLFAVFSTLSPRWGGYLTWLWIGLLLLVLGYEWSRAIQADFRRFYWTACLTLAAAPLLGLRGEMQNLVALLPALALTLAVMRERWMRWGNILVAFLILGLLTIPWLLTLWGTPSLWGLSREEFLYILYPLLTLLGLYWIRWWAIRSPRVWLDQVTRTEYP